MLQRFAVVQKLLIYVLLPCIHNTNLSFQISIDTDGPCDRNKKWVLKFYFSWFLCGTKVWRNRFFVSLQIGLYVIYIYVYTYVFVHIYKYMCVYILYIYVCIYVHVHLLFTHSHSFNLSSVIYPHKCAYMYSLMDLHKLKILR